MEVIKYTREVPMAANLLADRLPDFPSLLARRLREMEAMTPAEREQWHRDREREIEQARAKRLALQEATPVVPADLDVIAERLGLVDDALLHFSQPYCTCSMGHDGINYCQHATDLGLG